MRLIDADMLPKYTGAALSAVDVARAVENAPTIDPVKHGKWIECKSSEHWKCSACGCRASFWFNEENSSSYDLDMSEWLSGYCPNCGAKMDEEDEG